MIKRIWKKIKSWFWTDQMKEFGGYELWIHSNTDTFILFTGLFCKASGPLTIEI